MKKMLALMVVPLLLVGFASAGLAEVALKDSGPGQWTIVDSEGQELGTLGKVGQENPVEADSGGYSILPKGGQYIGVVRSDGNLQLSGRHPVISPSEAKLYLDVVEAIKTLK